MAVNIPWAAGIEQENLKDIAIITGATFIDNEHLHKLKDVTLEHMGTAQLVKVTEGETSIVDGRGSREDLEERIREI